MKASEVLREAAQFVDNHQIIYGCFAIYFAVSEFGETSTFREKERLDGRALKRFKLMQEPGNHKAFWFNNDRKHRVMALLMAAAIAESEGD